VRHPRTDDSALNLTPMIDVVFQLILFFLLSLRFKSLDHRHELNLPDRGLAPTPRWVAPIPAIQADVRRDPTADPATARTRVRIAGSAFDLPPARRTGDRRSDEALEVERRRVERAISSRIAEIHRETGLPGEISTPVTSGGLVPHGDVVLVLDAFVEAGVSDVKFVGARPPLPRQR
jgi:biopolymer transport protein ExbD